MPKSTRLGPRGMMGTLKDRIHEDAMESVGRLAHDQGGIFGPKHPRLLGGIDAVRDIPGAEFVAGGLLDVGEDIAFDTGSEPGEYLTAGLEVGGALPVGKVLGAAGRKIGEKFGIGRMADESEVITDADYFDEAITDADYPEFDSVVEGIRDTFGINDVDEIRPQVLSPDDYTQNLEKMTLGRLRTPEERISKMAYDEANPVKSPIADMPPTQHEDYIGGLMDKLREPDRVFTDSPFNATKMYAGHPRPTARYQGNHVEIISEGGGGQTLVADEKGIRYLVDPDELHGYSSASGPDLTRLTDEEWVEREARRMADEPYELDDITPYSWPKNAPQGPQGTEGKIGSLEEVPPRRLREEKRPYKFSREWYQDKTDRFE